MIDVFGPRADSRWRARIRVAYWLIGVSVGAFLVYAGRYFINGDAIAYIEMGEALTTGEWNRLANLTYSPGFPILLGLAQWIPGISVENEIFRLKLVNLGVLILAMAAFEVLVSYLERDMTVSRDGLVPLPSSIFRALCYAVFLTGALVMIRMRLINPDMSVTALIIAACIVLMRIRFNPTGYGNFALLGAVIGAGYLVKAFFFVFSPVFFAAAVVAARSVRTALPRLLLTLAVMGIISAPLIAALSHRLGRLTYGEVGKHAYAHFVSGTGTPIHPETIHTEPDVYRFVYDVNCTRPSGFDICYWQEGVKPNIDPAAHAKLIPRNLFAVFDQSPWLVFVLLWLLYMGAVVGSVRVAPFKNGPPVLFLGIVVAAGISFYCLIHMEPRYIASFVIIGFAAGVSVLRLNQSDMRARSRAVAASVILVVVLLGLLGYSAVDRTARGLISSPGKPSYKAVFQELARVSNALTFLSASDRVAIVGAPRVYWARMAGTRIIAEIPNQEAFLSAPPGRRQDAMKALKESGIRAVIGEGQGFSDLTDEGWQRVKGTEAYHILRL